MPGSAPPSKWQVASEAGARWFRGVTGDAADRRCYHTLLSTVATRRHHSAAAAAADAPARRTD